MIELQKIDGMAMNEKEEDSVVDKWERLRGCKKGWMIEWCSSC